ncbi:MAG TPA: NADH-quinone oxidoreductase subunit A [bacterium]
MLLFNYAYILIFILAGVLFVFFSLFLSRLLAPSTPDPKKQLTYECGEVPAGLSWIQFNIRFYIIALTFIIFDVELVLILPAVASYLPLVKQGFGFLAFLEIFIFIGVLIFGLAYLWAKGDLEWVKKVSREEKT